MTRPVGELLAHRDERGEPCSQHPGLRLDALMHLALVGTRASAFNHDCASKLQGLLMALDDLSETGDARTRAGVETALAATRELHQLLNAARALTKPAAPAAIRLRDLVLGAAERIRVTLRGELLPDAEVVVSPSAAGQALSLAFDVAAGPGRSRDLAFTLALGNGAATLSVACAPSTPTAGELLAIAAFTLAHDGGALSCAADGSRMIIRLPLRA